MAVGVVIGEIVLIRFISWAQIFLWFWNVSGFFFRFFSLAGFATRSLGLSCNCVQDPLDESENKNGPYFFSGWLSERSFCLSI